MSLEAKLIDYIQNHLVPGALPDLAVDSDLVGEGILDSTAFMQLVLWIEDQFGHSVDVDDMTPENFGTVRNMAEYVRRKAPDQVTQG